MANRADQNLLRTSRRGGPRRDAGSALLMAIFTTTVLLAIATEVMYQTTIESKVSAQGVNKLKAYYAAKAGAELGLFRIFLFRKVVVQFGEMVPDKSMLDMIWNFPFMWPPKAPEELNMVDKEIIAKSVKSSLMGASYMLQIESEGSKIDINDLASPSKVVAASTREQLMQIFNDLLQNDEEFSAKYRGFDFNRLINNITDWVDENTQSLNGGDERSLYNDVRNDFIPPNQPLKTPGELHMVAGMTDEFYEILARRITVYGTKGINIRYASKEVLRSLSPQITEEIAKKVIEARNNPQLQDSFKGQQEFTQLLNSLGVQGDPFKDGNNEKVPLIFDAEYNFRIYSVGSAGGVERQITAITYDFDSVKARLGEFMKKQAQADGQQQGQQQGQQNQDANNDGIPDNQQRQGQTPQPGGQQPGQQQQQKAKPKIPQGRPNVVYWIEG